MKKQLATKVVGSSVAVFVCVGLVYLLLFSGEGRTISTGPKSTKASDAISRPITATPSQAADQNAQPQEKVAGPTLSAIAQAEAALEDPDIGKRVQAVLSLRNELSSEAVAVLARYLNDKEGVVVKAAINTLGVIGLGTANEVLKKQALDLLLERAKDKAFPSRGHALITCAKLGEDDRTFQLIGEFIAEERDLGMGYASRALAFMVSPAIFPYVAEILKKTKDPEASRNAYALLAEIGTQEALTLLLHSLSSRKEMDRVNAAWALSLKNEFASNAMVIEAMAGNNLPESTLSVIANSPAGPAIYGAILDLNIPKEDKLKFLGVLSGSTMNAPGSVRDAMAEMLKSMINGSDPDLRLAAIEALGKSGATTDQSGVLSEQFDAPSFLVRGAALEAFIQYCTPSNYKELKKLWYDEDEKTRRTAFFFSENFLNKSDLEDLNKATGHKDSYIADSAKVMVAYLSEE